ncbi:hypothetical protein AGOR_G00190050 [Albula goreensis]|uniref:Butyrophilin subfamily 1 member A1-like n=1 Tax=Albula goreensis TaxID=1534307 RepID=A0A8T3CVV3_9TELE|nr:hypothetical protein AGOR_G00190050 [Albula goreensis]
MPPLGHVKVKDKNEAVKSMGVPDRADETTVFFAEMKGDGSECLCLILLLLNQTPVSRPEKFQVFGPDSPVVAVAGEDVVLPCYLKPNISAEDMTVEWIKLYSKDTLVHLYQEREIRNENQIPSYRGRTALFPEELKKGNVSLRLSRVRGSDEGKYTCLVKLADFYDDASILLQAGAVGSEPEISMEGYRGEGISLLCESKGWRPKPELTWLDSEGHSLSAEDTETHADSEGFYTVRRRIIVQETNTNRFTCNVLLQQLKLEKQTDIHIHAELFPRIHAGIVILSLILAVASISFLAFINYHVSLRRKTELNKEKKEWETACRFAVDVILNPDTAHCQLILSEDGKEVRCGDTRQDVTPNPMRFQLALSVLAKEGYSSGRFYYEVLVGEKIAWTIGVAKESIFTNKAIVPRCPENGFWIVRLRNGTGYITSDICDNPLQLREKPKTVGVYVDYDLGQVSFYNVEARSHIYSFTCCTFTEKLYPYLSPCSNENARNSAPLIISTVRQAEFRTSRAQVDE